MNWCPVTFYFDILTFWTLALLHLTFVPLLHSSFPSKWSVTSFAAIAEPNFFMAGIAKKAIIVCNNPIDTDSDKSCYLHEKLSISILCKNTAAILPETKKKKEKNSKDIILWTLGNLLILITVRLAFKSRKLSTVSQFL